jgi:tRNA nucleotidyltransferase (CCA-adding enzyme)
MLSSGKEVLNIIESFGHEAYFVGGCVRDLILEREIDDIDICTSALPEEICSIFSHTIPTGIKHGTVTVIWKDNSFEVTTFRTEGEYKNARHPEEVHFVRSLKKDLERRDFTINAIAMDRNGQLLDFFEGQDDMRLKRIQAVGEPIERLSEDALRILRAIRFSAQLGFSIEERLFQAIRSNAQSLELISMERMTSEFVKIMAADEVNQGLHYLTKGEIVQKIFPFSLLTNAFHKAHLLPLNQLKPIERWMLLLSLAASKEQAVHFLEALKLAKKWVKELEQNLDYLFKTNPKTRAEEFELLELFYLGMESAEAILKVNQIKAERQINNKEGNSLIGRFLDLPIKNKKELKISGSELIDLFKKPPGPWIEATLQLLVESVVMGEVKNEKQCLMAYILEREVK